MYLPLDHALLVMLATSFKLITLAQPVLQILSQLEELNLHAPIAQDV